MQSPNAQEPLIFYKQGLRTYPTISSNSRKKYHNDFSKQIKEKENSIQVKRKEKSENTKFSSLQTKMIVIMAINNGRRRR